MEKQKKRIFEIISIGTRSDAISTGFDIVLVIMILLNISILVIDTFDASAPYRMILDTVEWLTVFFFTLEYLLRIWTAEVQFPKVKRGRAIARYMLSFDGVVSLLTLLPYFVPMLFTSGIVVFRMLRVFRVFHLFRVNSQYDAFNVVLDVLRNKAQQILSSVMLILIMMLASSICMYSLEHDAQPEVFANAFSGIWWSVSTLLTVGYGDIYPVTLAGQIMAIVISFLGVGLVAIPTGIISAGFVEQFTRMKSLSEVSEGSDMRFIMLTSEEGHPWVGKKVSQLLLPPELVLVTIVRNEEVVIPSGDTVIHAEDKLVLGATEFEDETVNIKVREFMIIDGHIWINKHIKNLVLPENTIIVSILRDGKSIIPRGDTLIKKGDIVTVCEKRVYI